MGKYHHTLQSRKYMRETVLPKDKKDARCQLHVRLLDGRERGEEMLTSVSSSRDPRDNDSFPNRFSATIELC